jgi:cytochrome P450
MLGAIVRATKGDSRMPNTGDPRLDPYPHYARMRAQGPVLRDPQFGVWTVYGYREVHAILNSPDVFSSAQLNEPSIFVRDPPEHTRQRKRLAKAFSSERMAALEVRVREIADRLVDRVMATGGMDLIADFALPLPVTVIAELMGVPVQDEEQFKRWSDDLILYIEASLRGTEPDDALVASRLGFGEYLEGLIEQRRQALGEDLVSLLLAEDAEAEPLAPLDIVATCRTLLVAGHETTTNLIGNIVWTLFEHPQVLARLHAQPQLLPAVIEEVLRYRSPVQFSGRTAARDAELGGQRIAAGERVMVFVGSANRDPAVFVDPDRFDIDRVHNRHLAFGWGIHFCLGALLARLEARVALQVLLQRMPALRPQEGVVWEPVPSSLVFGLARLPVRWD